VIVEAQEIELVAAALLSASRQALIAAVGWWESVTSETPVAGTPVAVAVEIEGEYETENDLEALKYTVDIESTAAVIVLAFERQFEGYIWAGLACMRTTVVVEVVAEAETFPLEFGLTCCHVSCERATLALNSVH
jgi:hypothetical protein